MIYKLIKSGVNLVCVCVAELYRIEKYGLVFHCLNKEISENLYIIQQDTNVKHKLLHKRLVKKNKLKQLILIF